MKELWREAREYGIWRSLKNAPAWHTAFRLFLYNAAVVPLGFFADADRLSGRSKTALMCLYMGGWVVAGLAGADRESVDLRERYYPRWLQHPLADLKERRAARAFARAPKASHKRSRK